MTWADIFSRLRAQYGDTVTYRQDYGNTGGVQQSWKNDDNHICKQICIMLILNLSWSIISGRPCLSRCCEYWEVGGDYTDYRGRGAAWPAWPASAPSPGCDYKQQTGLWSRLQGSEFRILTCRLDRWKNLIYSLMFIKKNSPNQHHQLIWTDMIAPYFEKVRPNFW